MPFATHEHLEVPPGNAIIWRYMGLDKFLDLITNSRLFFTNVQNLTDKYETSLPANLARKRGELVEKERTGELVEAQPSTFEQTYRAIRETTLVNCWSLGRNESYALWKVYLRGARAGVAIRTSISNLREAITKGGELDNLEIYIGKVQYTDFMPEKYISEYNLVTIKRVFYEYEQELRLFILRPPYPEPATPPVYNPTLGRYVKIDVSSLVEKLYLSPFMGAWFKDAIVKILEKVQPEQAEPKLAERIVMSSILDE